MKSPKRPKRDDLVIRLRSYSSGSADERMREAAAELERLRALVTRLVDALRVALRAPGIHATDQETCEPFATTINAALKQVRL